MKVKYSVQGLRIRLWFSVKNAKSVRCRATAYFELDRGSKLRDFNRRYRTTNGQVAVGKDFTPGFDNTIYEKFELLMPHSELHLPKGTFNLRFLVRLYEPGGNRQFAISDYVYFRYSNWL